MRILFLWPGAAIPGFASLKVGGSNEASYVNHGLCSISAVLKEKGHECWLIDLRGLQSWEHYEQVIQDQKFDLAIIGFMSCDAVFAEKMCALTKKHHPNIPIIAGGVHLSVTKAETFPNVDHVVWGEGDLEVLNIVEKYENNESVATQIQASSVLDLDALPFEDRGLFNNIMETGSPLLPALPTPFITVVFGRGCPYKCSFCYPSRDLIFGNKFRMRSVSHIMEELSSIRANSGIGSLMIHDDLFSGGKWMPEFIESFGSTMGFIPFWAQMRADWICKHPEYIKGLSETGLTWVSVGLEAGSQRMLDFMNKGTTVEQNIEACDILRRNKVNTFANFIMGYPEETPEDLQASVQMLKHIRPEWLAASTYTSYPGSDVFEYCKQHDLFMDEHYSTTRYPYERKIKGIDYDLVSRLQSEVATFQSPIMEHQPSKVG